MDVLDGVTMELIDVKDGAVMEIHEPGDYEEYALSAEFRVS